MDPGKEAPGKGVAVAGVTDRWEGYRYGWRMRPLGRVWLGPEKQAVAEFEVTIGEKAAGKCSECQRNITLRRT